MLVGASIVIFSLIHLVPGDPAIAMLGPMATGESLQAIREQLHLTDPLLVQYLRWLSGVLRGDLGTSIFFRRPVKDEIADHLGPSVLLAGTSFLLVLTVGVSLGTLAGAHRRSWWTAPLMTIVSGGVSIPPFVLGLLFIVLFSLRLGWLPSGGLTPPGYEGSSFVTLRYLILPAVALAAAPTAVVTRITRASILESFSQDYIRTAYAKGLSNSRVVVKHALRNAILPVIHLLSLQLGYLFAAAALVEVVFAWPGIGSLLVRAVVTRDLPLVQGSVLLLALFYVTINLVADMLHALADPRVRLH